MQTAETTQNAAEAKPAKVELMKANGATRPRAGGITARIWEIADQISAKEQRPALRKEVVDQAKAENLNLGMAATQYSRWCKFHGLVGDKAPTASISAEQKAAEQAEKEKAKADAKAEKDRLKAEEKAKKDKEKADKKAAADAEKARKAQEAADKKAAKAKADAEKAAAQPTA